MEPHKDTIRKVFLHCEAYSDVFFILALLADKAMHE